MKKIFSKKLFAVILSLALIASVSFIPQMITASAAEADATTSLLYGISADYSNFGAWGQWNAGTYSGTIGGVSTASFLTDGNTAIGSHKDLYNAKDKTLTWQLKERSEITSVAMWNYQTPTMETSYKVYVSDTLDTLYTDDSLVYTHVATGTSNVYQNPKSGDEDFTVRSGNFVGVYITAPGTGSDTSSRLREFAAYGTPDSTGYESVNVVNTMRLASDVAVLDPENIIADAEPYEAYTTKVDGTSKATLGGGANWKIKITDGDGIVNNKADAYGTGIGYITYKLSELYDITGYAFFQGSKSLAHNVEFYVGTDPTTLYDEANKRDTFTVTDVSDVNTRFGHTTTFGNANISPANYVGFKITNISSTDMGIRISELQVFGKGGATATIKRTAVPADANNTSLIYGKKFTNAWCDEYLLQTKPENEYKYTGIINGYQGSLQRLTDGAIINNGHADVFAYHSKLVWQLDQTTDITSFLLYNGYSFTQSSEYRVYAAENLDDLFADESMIYSYTYKTEELGDTIDSEKLAEKGQYVDFYGNDVKTANFVGVWLFDTENSTTITDPAGSGYSHNKDFRINEIAFYGTPTGEKINYTYRENYTSGRKSYTDTAAINADFTYENNLLSTENVTAKNSSGNVFRSSALLTNGVADEAGGNYTNCTFTYSMPNVTEFSGFAFFSGNNDYKHSYKVYVGYSADSLYDETNCVFTWNWKKNPRGNLETVEFADGYATGLYLGIKITDISDGWARISEWAAWGSNDPSYSVNSSLAAVSDVSTASTHTNLLKDVQVQTGMSGETSGFYKITDGVASAGAYADVYGNGNVIDWNYGEMLFELNYPATVHSFALWQTHADTKFGYEVYMSDDKGTLNTEANKVFTWHAGYDSSSWGQMVTWSEAKTVKYVLVKILDTTIENDSIRVGEIALYGEYLTADDGQIPDSNFVGIDSNDIDAVSAPDKIYYTSTFTFPAASLGYTLDSFGTLVYPTTALGSNELTIDFTDAAAATAGSDLVNTVKGYADDGYKAVRTTAVFNGASSVGATTKLTARSYVIYKDSKNNDVVFYSDPVSYSVTQMKRLKAKNLINNYGQSTLAQTEITEVAGKALWNAEINDVWDFAIMSGTNVNAAKDSAVDSGSAWLSDMMNTYGVTSEMLENGIRTYGDTARTAKVLRKLMNGEDITLVQLGGSITEGYYANSAETSQGAQVYNFLNAAFPGQITFVNAGIAATGSEFGRYRLQSDVLSYNPDMVIVEYAVNDDLESAQANGTYESVMRALLSDSNDIAVIALYNRLFSSGKARRQEIVVNDYYNLPQMDVTTAYYSAPFYKNDGSSEDNFFGNNETTHPSTAGHARVGMLTANYLLNILSNISDQSTVIAAISANALRTFGNYDIAGEIIKSSELNAGSAAVTVKGGTYKGDDATQSVGSNVVLGKNAGTLTTVRANNTYSYYELANGESMTFTMTNANDAFLLFKMSNDCGNANITITDANGAVVSKSETAAYSGSLTVENARIFNSTRLFHKNGENMTVTVTADGGYVRIAGVLFAGNN